MKAVILKAPGGVDQLEYREIKMPEIGIGEVLIKVKAISINPVDTKVRQGGGVYKMLAHISPLILGWDISGTVEKSSSDLFNEGDEVFGMVNFPGHGQGYAEYVAAPAAQLAHKPKNISFETAASATLVALTAWQALVRHGKVGKGQKVLIHAAAGGVGHIAVQLAKYLGAEVTGTSSASNKQFVLELGADKHIDHRAYDWSSAAREYDLVLDTVGGSNTDHSIAVTKKGGTVISIPTGLDESVTQKARSMGVSGYFILVKSDGEDQRKIADLVGNGVIKPHLSRTFGFSDIRDAHLQIESRRTVGKVVVSM